MVTTSIDEQVRIYGADVVLPGDLKIPRGASSLVLFSHGSGSSRHSPRNQLVAQALQRKGIGTLLFDLLAVNEDSMSTRFDIPLLTARLLLATIWISGQSYGKGLNIGYFGASTGAASALKAAAELGKNIKAVVSRGGRPDLAMSSLPRVSAATLLLVGEMDQQVLQLSNQALEKLPATKALKIIQGAGHLFEEPGTLEQVAELASEWFDRYMSSQNTIQNGWHQW